MVVLKRHARLLYLLALFQLLGGPIVLGGLMLVTRLMADREMTFSQSVSETLQAMDQAEASAAGEWTWTEDKGLSPPAKPKLPLPKKVKDSKDKFWVVNDLEAMSWRWPQRIKICVQEWHDPVPLRLANAPPIPPPRWG